MAKIIKAPYNYEIFSSKFKVFLAGSIEMGVADNWQEKVQEIFSNHDWLILNPRRDNWDSTWEQKISNPNFYEQVDWEYNALNTSDAILMYFDPATKSPISLMELGLFANSGKLVVCCPEGFWRKGNVEYICHRFGIPLTESLEEACSIIQNKF